jgi:peptidyl-prolyl cis-trans isomerase D
MPYTVYRIQVFELIIEGGLAMLEQMHKHMNWILWAIIVLITVTFLFFGIYPSAVSGRTVARVDGYVIGSDEVNRVYQNMYENYRQIMKDQKEQMNENISKALRVQALRELVQNRLIVQEADRVGLRVTDEELQSYIVQIPVFNNQGRFDRRAYERALQNINMTPALFEQNQRDLMLRQKLEHLVEDGVAVTDAELSSAYAARIPKDKHGDFEKNKEAFRQAYIKDKQRATLDAFVKGLENKASIKIEDKSFAL